MDTRMRNVVVLCVLMIVNISASQPRKVFHEHWNDFLDVLMSEAGDELQKLTAQYATYEEFWISLDYMKTNNFKDLVYEMENLLEFRTVVDYLEHNNIDMHYFIELLNQLVETFDKKTARLTVTGCDLSSFIADCIAVFPKEKLSALFEQKMAEDEEFRSAIENLSSNEWEHTLNALLDNETFQHEMKTLLAHGIDVHLILQEVKAVFGQF